MITVTSAAAEQIQRQLDNHPNATGIRVTVVEGGCSGSQYKLDFSEWRRGDYLFISIGVLIIVDELTLKHVNGMKIDYQEGLHGAGIVFDNPNASRSCGCGSSFATK